jgi:hypothetical protein
MIINLIKYELKFPALKKIHANKQQYSTYFREKEPMKNVPRSKLDFKLSTQRI